MNEPPRLIIVTGPTAVGKTAVAVELAQALGTEIVSADSMQVYRHLSIGTAKPVQSELKGVPCHLIDFVDPDYQYSAGDFVRDADAIIAQVLARGKLPIVCGGTGMYLQALVQGLFEVPGRDAALRARIDRIADHGGLPRLHALLRRIDPGTKIMPNDHQRIQRALEVYYLTGQPISRIQTQKNTPPRYDAPTFVLTLDRPAIYRRIEARVDRMLQEGLLEEVRAYLAAGFSRINPAIAALGYAELIDHLEGRMSLEDAVATMKKRTRNYAKRQMTWFRRIPKAVFLPVDAMSANKTAEEIKKRLVLDRHWT